MEHEGKAQQRESLPQTLFGILLKDALSEVTRKERLYLLGVSFIGITIEKTGLVPSRIAALGIEFEQADQNTLLLLFGLVILYFFVAFIIYGVSDVLAWLESYRAAKAIVDQPIIDRFKELALQRDILGLPAGSATASKNDAEHELTYRTRIAEEQLRELEEARRPAVGLAVVRLIFEYVLPVALGAYAVWILVISPLLL